jgi:hypothetical protein
LANGPEPEPTSYLKRWSFAEQATQPILRKRLAKSDRWESDFLQMRRDRCRLQNRSTLDHKPAPHRNTAVKYSLKSQNPGVATRPIRSWVTACPNPLRWERKKATHAVRLPCALVVTKEEQFILDDWAAKVKPNCCQREGGTRRPVTGFA